MLFPSFGNDEATQLISLVFCVSRHSLHDRSIDDMSVRRATGVTTHSSEMNACQRRIRENQSFRIILPETWMFVRQFFGWTFTLSDSFAHFHSRVIYWCEYLLRQMRPVFLNQYWTSAVTTTNAPWSPRTSVKRRQNLSQSRRRIGTGFSLKLEYCKGKDFRTRALPCYFSLYPDPTLP